MPPITPAIAREIANGARDAIRAGAAVITGNQGDYIANGAPESVYGKIQQETARQYCRRYADNPGAYNNFAKPLVENACRPYLDDIGYGGQPQLKLPFRGGQCEDVLYDVTWTGTVYLFSDCSGPVNTGSTLLGVRGPIRNLRGAIDPASPNPTCAEQNIYYFDSGPNSDRVTLFGSGPGAVLASFSVARSDGQPDNCGSPPPDIIDPSPVLPPGPRTEPYSPTPDIDIDITLEVNPDLSFEVDLGTGPITVDPFGDGGSGGPGGGPGSPGNPSETGPGGEAGDEAPEGQVLTGLKIDFVDEPIGGNEYAPGVYRGVCYIYMGTEDGLDHDPAGAMLRDGQFVYAEKDYLTKWEVSANLGYSLRVTPYYRPIEAEE